MRSPNINQNTKYMSNIDKLSSAIGEWGYNVASSLLPKVRIPEGSAVWKFMYGMLGIDPSRYNVWSELGFLAEPVIKTAVYPMISRYMGGMTDAQIKDVAYNFVNAFIEKTRNGDTVNIFGVQLGDDAFKGLKDIMDSKFNGNEDEGRVG